MIKNFQKYLLLNHPLLWNIKIVPVLMCTILINLFFFLIGYLSKSISFTRMDYYYEDTFSSGVIIFASVIASILTFILWLVFYSKNNAFKSFYPKKASSIYLEWILILVIIFSTFSYPLSYLGGSINKMRLYTSRSEMKDAIETLNMVRILIPTNKNDYFKEYPTEDSYQRVQKGKLPEPYDHIDSYMDSISNRNQQVVYEDYPNFAQLSLLNYNLAYDEIYIPRDYDFSPKNIDDVKQWLIDNDKDKIQALMNSFLKLAKKHHLETNLDSEQWLKLIYNPSKYPVGDFNLIDDTAYREDSYYYTGDIKYNYHLPYRELSYAYSSIMNSYMDDTLETVGYVILCLAIIFSLFVLGFRSTSGKSWLIAFISMGLILFINGLISLCVSGFSYRDTPLIFYLIVLIGLFLFEIITVINKNGFRWKKGKSDIFMNHLLIYIPTVPVLIYSLIYVVAESNRSYSYEANYDPDNLYDFLKTNSIYFLWANICLTFGTVWLFIKFVLLKWKSLPEE